MAFATGKKTMMNMFTGIAINSAKQREHGSKWFFYFMTGITLSGHEYVVACQRGGVSNKPPAL